jgi:hypothetical protein
LDQDDLLIGKGAFITRNLDEATIELSSEISVESLPVGREVHVRLFDTVNGLTTYRGFVKTIEDNVLTVGNYEIETHIERREDVKVMVNRPAFLIARERNERNVNVAQKFTVILRDISAGGVGIVSEHELFFDRVYEIVFDLGREPDILSIMLVRKNINPQGKYVYGCRFVDLHPSQESQVREYVFKKHLGLVGRKNQ